MADDNDDEHKHKITSAKNNQINVSIILFYGEITPAWNAVARA